MLMSRGLGTSFWQYKLYADIRRSSLERRHQTTLGSRVNARAAACCRMLFILCVRNKLAGSSDVGLGRDRR